MKIQSNISFGISLESKKYYLDLLKKLIKILFSSNFGMQISAKIWDYLKNNKNLNPFVKFKGILVLGFHLNQNNFI